MTAPAVRAASWPRVPRLPWRSWLADLAWPVRALVRVEWTGEKILGLAVAATLILATARWVPQTTWTGMAGVRTATVTLGVLAVLWLVGAVATTSGRAATRDGCQTICEDAPPAARRVVGRRRIRIKAHRNHGGGHDAVGHEALGHAAVGYGVQGHGRGIRARVYRDGSGWCEVPRRRTTVAESLAITLGGELAAGPSGCEPDRKRYRRGLRSVPRRQQARVDAEAHAIAARHVGNAFGRKVARRLHRTGRYR